MKPIALGNLIGVGNRARYLLDVKSGWRIHGKHYVADNIEMLLSNLEALKFKVTLQAAANLRRLLGDFKSYSHGTKTSKPDAARLHRVMQDLRLTLGAESKTLRAYLLTEKRLDVERLVDNPESFLGMGTFLKLPEIAQFDIREAGKCIAFDLPTAGAFHLLRATEDALRAYYKIYFKHGVPDRGTWGTLVHNLENKKKKPRPDETLLAHLNHIRKNFRNPTDHPERIHDMDGVQDLFSLVADVLNRIVKELPQGKSFVSTDKAAEAFLNSPSSTSPSLTEETPT